MNDMTPELLRDTLRMSIECGSAAMRRIAAEAWALGQAAGIAGRATVNPYLPVEVEPEPAPVIEVHDE